MSEIYCPFFVMTDPRPTQWLSFSNSDQRILCEETHGLLWDALVVPGTLATYYKQGVGGYVLASRKPFVIDPRTPLIQPSSRRPRPTPRASHKTLAGIHDEQVGLLWGEGKEVPLEAWTAERWRSTVASVLEFQTSFESAAAEKIHKYERMLREAGMDLDIPIHGPARLVPPYWSVRGSQDPWWGLTKAAVFQAAEWHGGGRLMPVLCVANDSPTATFGELIGELPEGLDRIFCWRGAWDEAKATKEDIDGWLSAIDAAAMRGIDIVNMYGGALSVLLTGRGLAGVNHGVGYSESRSEERLGSTGAPPMRYYVPRLRQFLPVPQAQRALEVLAEPTDDWRCDCAICGDRHTIVDLKTDALKKHFLLSRRSEFEVVHASFEDAVAAVRSDGERLIERFKDFEEGMENVLAKRGHILVAWAASVVRPVAA